MKKHTSLFILTLLLCTTTMPNELTEVIIDTDDTAPVPLMQIAALAAPNDQKLLKAVLPQELVEYASTAQQHYGLLKELHKKDPERWKQQWEKRMHVPVVQVPWERNENNKVVQFIAELTEWEKKEYFLKEINKGHHNTVRALLHAGVDPNTTYEGYTNVNLNAPYRSYRAGENWIYTTPLLFAIMGNAKNVMRELIRAGADVNKHGEYKRNIYSTTPLIAATLSDDEEALKILLTAKADPEGQGSYRDNDSLETGYGTALMAAAIHGHANIVEKLLAAKVNPREKGEYRQRNTKKAACVTLCGATCLVAGALPCMLTQAKFCMLIGASVISSGPIALCQNEMSKGAPLAAARAKRNKRIIQGKTTEAQQYNKIVALLKSAIAQENDTSQETTRGDMPL